MLTLVLKKYGESEDLITIVKYAIQVIKTMIRMCFGTSPSEVKVGLQQGSALHSGLFIILMDYVSRKIPTGKGQKLLYADDTAIKASSKEDLTTS